MWLMTPNMWRRGVCARPFGAPPYPICLASRLLLCLPYSIRKGGGVESNQPRGNPSNPPSLLVRNPYLLAHALTMLIHILVFCAVYTPTLCHANALTTFPITTTYYTVPLPCLDTLRHPLFWYGATTRRLPYVLSVRFVLLVFSVRTLSMSRRGGRGYIYITWPLLHFFSFQTHL